MLRGGQTCSELICSVFVHADHDAHCDYSIIALSRYPLPLYPSVHRLVELLAPLAFDGVVPRRRSNPFTADPPVLLLRDGTAGYLARYCSCIRVSPFLLMLILLTLHNCHPPSLSASLLFLGPWSKVMFEENMMKGNEYKRLLGRELAFSHGRLK